MEDASLASSRPELYDAATGTWKLAAMVSERDSHTATLLQSGQVMVVGGFSASGPLGALADVELYSPP